MPAFAAADAVGGAAALAARSGTVRRPGRGPRAGPSRVSRGSRAPVAARSAVATGRHAGPGRGCGGRLVRVRPCRRCRGRGPSGSADDQPRRPSLTTADEYHSLCAVARRRAVNGAPRGVHRRPGVGRKTKPQVTARAFWGLREPPGGFEPTTFASQDRECSCCVVPGCTVWCCSA
jgi:hypothetical protein